MTDIVERLRGAATLGDLTTTSARNLMEEAADRIAELEAALHRIEYLDRPQVRGLPRRKTIQEIARAALGDIK